MGIKLKSQIDSAFPIHSGLLSPIVSVQSDLYRKLILDLSFIISVKYMLDSLLVGLDPFPSAVDFRQAVTRIVNSEH